MNRRPYHKLQSLRSPFRTKVYADISKGAYELVTILQATPLRPRVSGTHNRNQITLTLYQEKSINDAEEVLPAPEMKEAAPDPITNQSPAR